MTETRWTWNRCAKVAAWGLALAFVVAAILELAFPGSVFCPIRRLAIKAGMDLDADEGPLETFSPEDRAWAEARAAEWRADALKRHPNLKIEPVPVPLEENGFWQLCELRHHKDRPAADFSSMLRECDEAHLAQAQAELEANAAWLNHLQWIAGLRRSSSLNLPEPTAFFSAAADSRQAHSALLLKALLAAKSGDEDQALLWARAAAGFSSHWRTVEAPTLYAETLHVLLNLDRIDMITRKILPALGRDARLPLWHQELARTDFTAARMAVIARGEWQYLSNTGYVGCALANRRRMLMDPQATTTAMATTSSSYVDRFSNSTLLDLLHVNASTAPKPRHLSPEGREMVEGASAWDGWLRGYVRCARVQSCQLAALELLMLEAQGRALDANDTKHVTQDPLSGKPFVFDPLKRTLDLPGGYPGQELDEPLKLAW